ncbi:MAG: DoxX family protein [Candidatus Paceibacterota bacterium]
MLNTFPYLLSYSSFAPLILRVFAGIYMLIFAYENLEDKWPEKYRLFTTASLKPEWFFILAVSAIELAGGVLLISGAVTQITSISLAVLMLVTIFIKIKKPELISENINTYILLLIILFSLIFTGAGNIASDLPF